MGTEMFWYKKLKADRLDEGQNLNNAYIMRSGILRSTALTSPQQEQTKETFGFKWNQLDSYQNDALEKTTAQWLLDRYLGGDPDKLPVYFPDGAKVLDAGCGSGFSALLLLRPRLKFIKYLGVDISAAVDVAKQRFAAQNEPGEFIQETLTSLPFEAPVFDVIFSEGVLHHTDNPAQTFDELAKLLLPGGLFMFYVYKKKGPIREFTDDYIRGELAPLSDSEAWEALRPLTRLGAALGELDMEVDVPQDIDFLGLKAGKINLQRLFYWHIFKAYYRQDYSLETMNHINYDWYRPLNCHRQTLEDVQAWCRNASLNIERCDVQDSGFTIVARKN
ncbi:class I SAM-dependent methyltransferase [Deltaproteobacteria bacterium OttesenSCG-928-K17]|nr:class I SAM-dependent methyltransferase [Deltaproteobacteria bacterium OttesenSCG-928-K17]